MPLLILLLILFCGCSDKYASLVDAAPIPQLSFDRDTVVLREKDYSFVATSLNPFLKLYAVPSPPQMNIQFTDSSGKLKFLYRGAQMEDGRPIVVAGDSTIIFCACDTVGNYAVDFYLTDHLGKTDMHQLIVQCVGNVRPAAGLTVSLLDSSLSGNWQYRIDGSTSVKQYGLIMVYQFKVNGAEVFSVQPFIDYTFHVRGEHSVSLFVTDDLGDHSDTLTQKIIIP